MNEIEKKEIEGMAKVLPDTLPDLFEKNRKIILGKSFKKQIAREYYNAGYRKVIGRDMTKALNYEIESLQVEDYKKQLETDEEYEKNLNSVINKLLTEIKDYKKEAARLKELITKIKEMIDKNFYYDNLTTSGELSDLLKEYGMEI